MTAAERIANIKIAHENRVEAETAAKNNEVIHRKELETELARLWPRIQEVLDVGNALRETEDLYPKGFAGDDNRLRKYNYSGGLIADGIRHRVGFMVDGGRYAEPFDRRQIKYLGIRNGGANGPYDFFTNGLNTFSIHEDTGASKQPRIEDIEKFISLFPKFESALYAWVDTVISSERV